ncbi:neuropeptide CCHamide-1 receptor-like isoform X2 [Leptidea sinapis]|uniref:neuropeptide CCHamide-1 receptor-like isoform X1 n=2 Tax=Leptidea sinapis TaxID=189913 RepID=UPI0021C445C5|nr:neuropeptide CCHamide-1 receptor-like isoform X1 [Leptidea sinapis]XP_050677210.1 neuropeptide CCHamide-1 receptor-like isoform X2 [Leptidea sinapis]
MEDYNDTLFLLNETEGYLPYSQRVETYVVPILFAFIFIIGVLGNGALVAVFIRHKAMRNVPNTYILSLALADLLVIVTCVPFTSIVYTVESWPWGATVCRLSEAAKDVSIGVSVFTLTALSADRYFAIVDPFRKLHASGGSKRATRLTVAAAIGIWVLAAALAMPAYIGSYVREFVVSPTKKFLVCYPYPVEWGEEYARLVVLLKFLIYYSMPLAVIALFYVLMARHLVLSTQNMPGEMQGTQRQMRARRKVALTVLAFVLVFAACFLPTHVFMMWFYYCPTAEEDFNAWWSALRIVGFCLSFLNSCVNPVALYCTSGIFRKHFNRYLFCRSTPPHGTRSSMSLSTSRRLNSSRKTNVSMMPRTTSIGRESSVRLLNNGSLKP